MIKRILIYINNSKASNKALDYSIYLAKELGASLIALYVVTVKAPKQLEPSNVPKELGREADKRLKEVKEKADSEGLKIKTKIMASRSPSNAISEEAVGGDYDIVVISQEDTGRVAKLLSKSATDEIVRSIPKPVLIIK